jgi:hypothetical protein
MGETISALVKSDRQWGTYSREWVLTNDIQVIASDANALILSDGETPEDRIRREFSFPAEYVHVVKTFGHGYPSKDPLFWAHTLPVPPIKTTTDALTIAMDYPEGVLIPLSLANAEWRSDITPDRYYTKCLIIQDHWILDPLDKACGNLNRLRYNPRLAASTQKRRLKKKKVKARKITVDQIWSMVWALRRVLASEPTFGNVFGRGFNVSREKTQTRDALIAHVEALIVFSDKLFRRKKPYRKDANFLSILKKMTKGLEYLNQKKPAELQLYNLIRREMKACKIKA